MLYFLYPSTLGRYLRDYQGEKSWALVTGSSDGIGKGIAYELCSHGFNVVLHGRNAEKLSRVQASLLAEYPKVQVRKVITDAPPLQSTTLLQICKTSTIRSSSITSVERPPWLLTSRPWKSTQQKKS